MKNVFRSMMAGLVLACVAMPAAYANEGRVQIVSKTHNVGSLTDGSGETITVTVPGAALGDACIASAGVDVVDMLVSCYVQAADAVEIRVQNESGSTADLASTTWRVFLFPKGTR